MVSSCSYPSVGVDKDKSLPFVLSLRLYVDPFSTYNELIQRLGLFSNTKTPSFGGP